MEPAELVTKHISQLIYHGKIHGARWIGEKHIGHIRTIFMEPAELGKKHISLLIYHGKIHESRWIDEKTHRLYMSREYSWIPLNL